VLAVWRLDRLGRSLPHLLAVAAELDTAGVELRSLTEAIDTTTAGGRPTLPPATIDAIRTLDQTGTPRTNIARALGISRSSVYRSL
jgi:DNA invertase Pin-like site-specific DNA recombinase